MSNVLSMTMAKRILKPFSENMKTGDLSRLITEDLVYDDRDTFPGINPVDGKIKVNSLVTVEAICSVLFRDVANKLLDGGVPTSGVKYLFKELADSALDEDVKSTLSVLDMEVTKYIDSVPLSVLVKDAEGSEELIALIKARKNKEVFTKLNRSSKFNV